MLLHLLLPIEHRPCSRKCEKVNIRKKIEIACEMVQENRVPLPFVAFIFKFFNE